MSYENTYHTEEPWSSARRITSGGPVPRVGDIHVLGLLVVVHLDTGRVVIWLCDSNDCL